MPEDVFQRLSRKEIYRNPWLAVEAHQILHVTGRPGEHLLVRTPQSCAVVVLDGDDLLFARQPRFAARKPVVEVVKGGCDLTESPADCARRELSEELGVRARAWSELGTLQEIPSIVEPPVICYVASDLEFNDPTPAEEESISILRLSIKDALRAAVAGEIDDAVTIAALFRFGVRYNYIAFSQSADAGSPSNKPDGYAGEHTNDQHDQ